MGNYVITIARGYGSGGKQIALKLAKELGIECYEHRILALASEYSNIDGERLIENDEKLSGSLMKNQLERAATELGLRPMTSIIVGKCADDILKGRPNVLNLYIEAPRAFCRERIMRRQQVDAEEADRLITSTDRYRADYYKFYTGGKEWTNPTNYDIVINSERMSFDGITRLIRALLEIRGVISE